MRVDRCSIELRNKKRKRLIPVATYGLKQSSYLRPALFIPITNNKKAIGAVRIWMKRSRVFTEEEIRFMTILASQAVSSVRDIKLTEDLETNYFNIIHTLVLAVEAKDPFMKGHSRRVTNYALRVAQRLGLDEEEIKLLYYSGELHDIGKIGISDKILNKPGKLTESEFEIIKRHPVKGVQMLQPLKFLEKGLPTIKHHHERFDGNGYPDRLKADQIPLTARILACTDSFDAMIFERPYKKRLTLQEAIEELKINSGTQFDPEVVKAFLEILPKEIS
jgi:HD-GYP domain-containing protein (c-di-GMP phosphodiesterase class II)